MTGEQIGERRSSAFSYFILYNTTTIHSVSGALGFLYHVSAVLFFGTRKTYRQNFGREADRTLILKKQKERKSSYKAYRFFYFVGVNAKIY